LYMHLPTFILGQLLLCFAATLFSMQSVMLLYPHSYCEIAYCMLVRMVKSIYMRHLTASVVTPAVMLLKLPLLWQEKDG